MVHVSSALKRTIYNFKSSIVPAFVSTLTFLTNGENLINGEDNKILPTGRVEKFFYFITIHVEGGKFLKIK